MPTVLKIDLALPVKKFSEKFFFYALLGYTNVEYTSGTFTSDKLFSLCGIDKNNSKCTCRARSRLNCNKQLFLENFPINKPRGR